MIRGSFLAWATQPATWSSVGSLRTSFFFSLTVVILGCRWAGSRCASSGNRVHAGRFKQLGVLFLHSLDSEEVNVVDPAQDQARG